MHRSIKHLRNRRGAPVCAPDCGRDITETGEHIGSPLHRVHVAVTPGTARLICRGGALLLPPRHAKRNLTVGTGLDRICGGVGALIRCD